MGLECTGGDLDIRLRRYAHYSIEVESATYRKITTTCMYPRQCFHRIMRKDKSDAE